MARHAVRRPHLAQSLWRADYGTRMVKFFIVLVFLGIIASSAGWVWAQGHTTPHTTYKSALIKPGNLDITVSATGAVQPFQSVLVGSPLSGVIREVRHRANDVVKRGDVLAMFDTNLLEAELHGAVVKQAQSEAALRALSVDEKSLDLREEKIKNQTERRTINADRFKNSWELGVKNRERYQQMVKASAISAAELEIKFLEERNAERDYRLASLDLQELQTDLRQIAIDRLQLTAKLEQLKADVLQAGALVERARTNLGYATIVAPIDGVVLEQWVDVGQTVTAGFQTTNLFRIVAALDRVLVVARIDEADIGRIHAGQEVSFEVDAYRGEHFSGTVMKIALQPETKANLVTYMAMIAAPNPADTEHPGGKLMPGMTANLRLFMHRRANVLLLPSAALRFSPGASGSADPAGSSEVEAIGTTAVVYVPGSDGEPQARSVKLGENDGEWFELTDGDIKEGARVITGQVNDSVDLDSELP